MTNDSPASKNLQGPSPAKLESGLKPATSELAPFPTGGNVVVGGWSLFRITAVVVVCGLIFAGGFTWLLGLGIFGSLPGTWIPGAAQKADTSWLNIVATALTIVGGIGGAVALVVAFRKQWISETHTVPRERHAAELAEAGEARAQAAEARETDRGNHDRYGAAVTQLGSDNPTVRLAGAYALANLADEWLEHREQCVDVLCAYLRLPWDPSPSEDSAHLQVEAPTPVGDGRQTFASRVDDGENEVRKTILRILASHLQPDDSRPHSEASWTPLPLDFTAATLPAINWSNCIVSAKSPFTGATFTGDAWFDGATFTDDADFAQVTFTGVASFDGATFSRNASFSNASFARKTHFRGVKVFKGAWFREATFNERVWFRGASFSGPASFDGTTFSGSVGFSQASFAGDADFSQASFAGEADFGWASFSGEADFGRVSFATGVEFGHTSFHRRARFGCASFLGLAGFLRTSFFSDANFGEASFSGEAGFLEASFSADANFREATFSDAALFGSATFSGDTWFDQAIFSDFALFDRATFSRDAWFDQTTFSGNALFGRATFSANAWLDRAIFSGEAWFDKAKFSGNVSLEGTTFLGRVSGAQIAARVAKAGMPDQGRRSLATSADDSDLGVD